jgi:hypothetical protein
MHFSSVPMSASAPLGSMKRLALCACLVLGVGASGRASTLLFDFSTPGSAAGGPGGTWNSFAGPANVSTSTVLVDLFGVATALKLTYAGNLLASANAGTKWVRNTSCASSVEKANKTSRSRGLMCKNFCQPT